MRPLRILIASIALALSSGAALAEDAPVVHETCGVLLQENGATRVEAVSGYNVIGAALPMQLPAGYDAVVGVHCSRAEFVIADSDHRVLTDLGVPLYLSFGDPMIVLEISSGQLRVRTVRGQLSESEIAAVQLALNRNQSILQGDLLD